MIMSQTMNRRHRLCVQLSNGLAPIDGVCLARWNYFGSDLA